MPCDVTRCVICTSNIVEYPDKEQSRKNSTTNRKSYIVILSDICNGVKKILGKILCHSLC